jgi:hypothetical protein
MGISEPEIALGFAVILSLRRVRSQPRTIYSGWRMTLAQTTDHP